MINFRDYLFEQSEWFWVIIILPFLYFFHFTLSRKRKNSLLVSKLPVGSSYLTISISFLPYVLRTLVIIWILAALAKPYLTITKQNERFGNSIDVMLSIDVSGSMNETDFRPTRLEAVKEIAKNYIIERPNDRIGINIYAAEALTICPPTLDHEILLELFDQINESNLEGGTAIGQGLANAVLRLRKSKSKGKVIILLSDGENNAGEIDPIDAALLAKDENIKVYTIGIGGYQNNAPAHVLDEDFNTYDGFSTSNNQIMKRIALITNAQYFYASDAKALNNIYNQIDKIEKSKLNVTLKKEKKYLIHKTLLPALILLLIDFVFSTLVFRRLNYV